jgi:hypothetical protein
VKSREWCAAFLKLLEYQVWNHRKASWIGGRDGVPQVPEQWIRSQIRERDALTGYLHLTIGLPSAESDRHGYVMYGHTGQEVIKKLLPASAALRSIGARDAVR